MDAVFVDIARTAGHSVWAGAIHASSPDLSITRYKQAGDYSCRYLHVAACTGENTYHNYTNLTKVKLALIHI